MSYFYGPIPSRRLGFSLGVDLIPIKVCSFDCIYCQVGRTTKKSIRRFSYIDLDKFKKELKDLLAQNPRIDYITFSGSGEPTLHKGLDKIIRIVKKITKNKYPVCIITNSSLLYRKSVRKELQEADLIIPSLDAATDKIFFKIDRPHPKITFKKVVSGLISLRKEFKGKIWLEIMLIGNINDSVEEAEKFRTIIDKIKPDKLQLNLPVRPAPEKLELPAKKEVSAFAEKIDFDIEVIQPFHRNEQKRFTPDMKTEIIKYLSRRPAVLDDLVDSLGINDSEVKRCLNKLLRENKIEEKIIHKKVYYVMVCSNRVSVSKAR